MLFAMVCVVHASDDWGWLGDDGKQAPNTDNRKSVQGFGGWLIVTRDPDWEKEWNTPSDHEPAITVIREVKVGEVIAMLPMIGNPKQHENGVVHVYCDILITRPDDSISLDEKGLNCFTAKLDGSPRGVLLSGIIPKFIGEEADPKGVWKVNMVLRDMVRGAEVSLNTQFTLVDG